MHIDADRMTRLIQLSKKKSYNPYDRFIWPDQLPVDRLWCDEDLLTTHGTDIHTTLTEQQLYELSKWEAINFFSLNVHGIKGVLGFICKNFYTSRYKDVSDYLHIFVSEENIHMWFFAKFCLRYGSKIYPSFDFSTKKEMDKLEFDFNMFASTLIFEEFVDFYNHKVGVNNNVAGIIREINHQHHIDESRHVSFGREIVKGLYDDVLKESSDTNVKERLEASVKDMFLHFINLMYNPLTYDDAGIVQSTGFQHASALRNRLRNDPERKTYHGVWFKRTADFFKRSGIIDDTSFLTE